MFSLHCNFGFLLHSHVKLLQLSTFVCGDLNYIIFVTEFVCVYLLNFNTFATSSVLLRTAFVYIYFISARRTRKQAVPGVGIMVFFFVVIHSVRHFLI